MRRDASGLVGLVGLALVSALGVGLVACGNRSVDGRIEEWERGRNGVKVEVRVGRQLEEVYLVPGTVCREGDYLADCADADDYLVPRPGATPGVDRPTRGR